MNAPLAKQPASPADDGNLSFLLESTGIRGRHLKLAATLETILSAHRYPEPVAQLLGEALALAATLAAALKYDGVFTLQTKGDGPVSMAPFAPWSPT